MDEAFMVGSALLVQPVVAKDQHTQAVFLPGEGQRWYHYDTHALGVGPARITVDAPLGQPPVFYRGGSIIPRKDRVRRSSSLTWSDPYTLVVAVDANNQAAGRLYFDDFETFAYESGAYVDKAIVFRDGSLSSSDYAHVPAEQVRLLPPSPAFGARAVL
jgi:alpha 1,3-glucosidase